MSMRHATARICLATLLLIACSFGAAGCRLGNYLSFSIQIPLGLNGTIGLLNPDGGIIGPGVDPPDDDDGTIIPPDIL